MIKSINASGRYVSVTGGNSSNYINAYSGLQGVGNVRYNTTTQQLEVYDGNNWMAISMDHSIVGLTGEAESLLDWAKQKRQEESEYKSLAETHPAVAAALANLNKAQEQLYIIAQLSKEHEKTTS